MQNWSIEKAAKRASMLGNADTGHPLSEPRSLSYERRAPLHAPEDLDVE
jgi:hypothetical protein